MTSRDDLSHYIPSRLDDPPKFLFWSWGIAVLAFSGVCLGVVLGRPFVGLFLGVGAAYAYGKFSAGRHPGTAMHLLYWYVGYPMTDVYDHLSFTREILPRQS